jgi:hypothetical protein
MPAVTAPALRLVRRSSAGLVAVHLHDQALDVQDDVVTSSITPGSELNSCSAPLELDVRDGRALEAGQQDAAEAVAHRRPEPALERLGRELAVRVGRNRLVTNHPAGQLESAPTDSHRSSPLRLSRIAESSRPNR